jgi:hypothetical protein
MSRSKPTPGLKIGLVVVAGDPPAVRVGGMLVIPPAVGGSMGMGDLAATGGILTAVPLPLVETGADAATGNGGENAGTGAITGDGAGVATGLNMSRAWRSRKLLIPISLLTIPMLLSATGGGGGGATTGAGAGARKLPSPERDN